MVLKLLCQAKAKKLVTGSAYLDALMNAVKSMGSLHTTS